MSMQDLISDMFTRIRNALLVRKKTVSNIPFSKVNLGIAKLLLENGYINDYQKVELSNHLLSLQIELKYDNQGRGTIAELKRISRPGLRRYAGVQSLPTVKNGLGIAIISTSKGLMTDVNARKAGVGGEVLAQVS